MAGLKVLQLINDNTAVALNYGLFRRKDINSTAQVPQIKQAGRKMKNRIMMIAHFNILLLSSRQNVMFYDMGSGSTTATIVTYQTVKTKEAGTQPQLQIRGVGLVLRIVLMLH